MKEIITIATNTIKVMFHSADRIELIVDSTGGTLHLKEEDIKLQIYSGAIEEGKSVNISLENIEIEMPVYRHHHETIISPIVKCGPEGTSFNKPCLLSFPHNAVNEENWEFTLLVKDRIEDKWKQILLESDENQIYTLRNGQCFVQFISFTCCALKGKINTNFGYAKKKIKFGVFGKRLENNYRLRLRLWNPGKERKIQKEQLQFGEQLLQPPENILCLYNSMEISVEIPNQEWQVENEKEIIFAENIWCKSPSKTFIFTRNDSSTNLLIANFLLSQGPYDIPPVTVSCDFETSSSNPDQMKLIVSSKGKTLHLKDEDIKLEIQPGAIEEGKKFNISLENVLKKIDMPISQPHESIISPIVKCGPEGTIFNKQCLLSFPHNAVNEENWEFTLLVKDHFHDKWRKIALESDEKDINFTLNNGRCCININHFSLFALEGHVRNFIHAKKRLKCGVFGKSLENNYQLRLRLWNPGKQRKIQKEHEQCGEQLLQPPDNILSLYKDIRISVAIPNQEWQVEDEKEIITAEYLWSESPSRTFNFFRNNTSTNLLKANFLLSQESNDIPPVKVFCETASSNPGDKKSPKKIKRKHRSEQGSSEDESEGTSLSRCQQSEDFSEDDFKQLIGDFAQWFDDRGLLNRLQVLFIGIVDDIEEVKRVTSTIDLLTFLSANGQLSKTDVTVLYDAIKKTEQFGFESCVTKKLPTFKNIKKRKVASFSRRTIKIFNMGKSLSDADIKTLDVQHNFPVLRKYADSWSLIMDLESRGLLSEDQIESIEKLLKR
ncbi:uncharacterized protein [Antedon mediterranea]|uniref:uncharacterized protein n=1 Tax=Antedon mediterranea TaxID=105859 RepID=UPI003AF9F39C